MRLRPVRPPAVGFDAGPDLVLMNTQEQRLSGLKLRCLKLRGEVMTIDKFAEKLMVNLRQLSSLLPVENMSTRETKEYRHSYSLRVHRKRRPPATQHVTEGSSSSQNRD